MQTKILQYHVLSSAVKGAAAVEAARESSAIATLLGEKVKLSMQGESVVVDDSMVTATDVIASNGIVHLVGLVFQLAAWRLHAPRP